MGMALSGLASGFDWKSIVDQLIEVSRTPQNRMRTEKTTNASKSSAINDIKGLLSSLKTSISSLATEESLYKKGVTFKDSTTNWKATASKDTPAGEYKVNLISEATVSKLTGSSNLVAALDADKTIAEISVGRTITTPGFFTINGQRVNVTAADKLQDVIDNIKSITGTADLIDDQIQIVSGSPLSLGAPNDTSNFLQAMQLAGSGTKTEGNPSITTDDVYSVTSSAPSLSAPKLNVLIKDSGLPGFSNSVAGSLEINGESISYDSHTDTIQTILDKINASEAGVSAIFDISQRVFSLSNKTTGNVGISVVDSQTNGLAAALGLATGTTVNGSDATFSVNGGGILTSRSNILDETAHGIKGLSVTANKIGEQTLTVAGDYTAAKDSLNDFITKYNAVQNAIEKYTKVTVAGDKVSSAILAGNRELATLSRSLRTMLYQAGGGITGSVQRLSDLGINFAGIEPTISLTKSNLLESKLATAADDIAEYFSTTENGLIDRLDKLLSGYVSDSGSAAGGLKAQLDSITKQNTSLDKQIEDVERRLASQRSLLESSFIAMERAQSGFQQQSAYLAKTFNNGK